MCSSTALKKKSRSPLLVLVGNLLALGVLSWVGVLQGRPGRDLQCQRCYARHEDQDGACGYAQGPKRRRHSPAAGEELGLSCASSASPRWILNAWRPKSATRSSLVGVGWSTRLDMTGLRVSRFPRRREKFSSNPQPDLFKLLLSYCRTPSGGLTLDTDRRSSLRERCCAAYEQEISGGS